MQLQYMLDLSFYVSNILIRKENICSLTAPVLVHYYYREKSGQEIIY